MVKEMMNIFKKILAREAYHPVLTYPLFVARVMICRARYARTVQRLHKKFLTGEKIKVVFLSMDTSKWKCQTIYDEMVKSDFYDPIVALTMTEEDETHTVAEVDKRNAESRAYYERHGCKVVLACDSACGKVMPLDQLNADVVFFQVPWGNLPGQRVWDVSKYALTCNMPYSIEFVEWVNRRKKRFDFNKMANFHSLMWANFCWSHEYVKQMEIGNFPWEWSGRNYGTGHSTLDIYTLESTRNEVPGACVIYAPHFSFPWNGHNPIMNFSTFPWSGKAILEYAKAHPEIKWAFKPHPKLRERLPEVGFMTKKEVDLYYAEWENLGSACYDGDYADMFFKSRAMVTDCSSFLLEYMPVGKPLIHLIPDYIKVVPCKAAEPVCNSFYQCHNLDEMYATFEQVLEKGEDPRKEQRQNASQKAMLLGNYAAGNVLSALNSALGVAK